MPSTKMSKQSAVKTTVQKITDSLPTGRSRFYVSPYVVCYLFCIFLFIVCAQVGVNAVCGGDSACVFT